MDYEIIEYIIIGFFAQLVDGSLGMAYGVISTTFLLSIGVLPAQASASVHTAEIFTTAASGVSHAMFKNVDWELCRRLVIPGVIGSILGAYLLTVIPSGIIKPGIAIYLMIIGIFILYKSLKEIFKKRKNEELSKAIPDKTKQLLTPIGLMGGFFDSLGGGGWGPIVTSSLISQDTHPRYTIGSVNLVEFVIAITSSMTFFMTIGITYWKIIIGLIIGGLFAAPLGAFFAKHIPGKVLMFLVGVLVMLISMRLIIMGILELQP